MGSTVRNTCRGLGVAAVTAALAFGSVAVSYADPVDDAKTQLQQLQQQLSEVDQQYAATQEQLDTSTKRLTDVRTDAASQQAKVAALKSQVSQVALQQYRSQGVDATTGLLVTDDVDAFLSKLSTVQKVTDNTNSLLQDYQAQQANLADLQRSADAEVTRIQSDQAKLAQLKTQSEQKVAAQQAVLDRLTEQQRQQLAAQQAAADAQAAAAVQAAPRPTVVSRDNSRPAATTTAPQPAAPVVSGSASSRAQGAMSFALSQVGKSYVMGATGPNSYDCSGLMLASYRTVGVGLPRTSQAQYGAGTPVSLSQLQPGDLVFYYSGISHVGMYIGNGQIVHAANPRSGVTTASVTSMPFMGGRRVA